METILVIEDEEDVRINITEILDLENFHVLTADNGRMGLELAKEHVPALIICDILMPEMNGYEVLTELQNDPFTAAIPFIFLTAKTARQDIRIGMQLGASDYLTKPFKIKELLGAVHTQLRKRIAASQQLEELRSSLSRILPHEFRTPLNSIIGFSDLLRDEQFLPQPTDIVKMAEAIYESGLRLQRLVENYLLYATLEVAEHDHAHQTLWQQQASINPKTLLISFSKKVAKRFQREHDLQTAFIETTIQISTKALAKIAEELLDNAFKFSTASTPVRIDTALHENQFSVSVNDHGRGMTVEQISRVSAFTQFDRHQYEQQGIGLGLAIVSRLARLNNGKLQIESTPHEGTTAKVAFQLEHIHQNET